MEELADVTVCVDVMTDAGIFDNSSDIYDLIEFKHARWEERIEEYSNTYDKKEN